MLARTLALFTVTLALLMPTSVPAQATPDNFSPGAGISFNNPVGDFQQRRVIFRKIMRSINSAPRGSEIYFFTWNFLTSGGTDALVKAQKRGVRVRLLMDDKNDDEIDNRPFKRLKRELRQGNDGRRKDRKSWARVCEKSCRGKTGSAHAKYFLFSQAGRSKKVVIHGSANFTLASTNNQWNDVTTNVDDPRVWKWFLARFKESAKDDVARPTYSVLDRPGFDLFMFPNVGRNVSDPVLDLLKKVRCRGALNTKSGRTVIRIAPDVMRHERGYRLGSKVRDLWERGCDVKIGYTVMGVRTGRMLRAKSGRGPVPMKHLVQDTNGDGEFDNYFHLKAMVVRGYVAGDKKGWAVLNGSANWSGLARVSDENLGIYYKRGIGWEYQQHLEYWYKNFPKSKETTSSDPTTPLRRDALIFGAGKDAVYANGDSVSDGTFNPFANEPED